MLNALFLSISLNTTPSVNGLIELKYKGFSMKYKIEKIFPPDDLCRGSSVDARQSSSAVSTIRTLTVYKTLLVMSTCPDFTDDGMLEPFKQLYFLLLGKTL